MGAHVNKRWSVNAISSGQEPLLIFCDGRPLNQTALATIENVSPVEHLLIAVASCFALSCRAVLATRKLPRFAFEVVVSGEQAPDRPCRLKHIAIVAIFRTGVGAAQAAAIAEDARFLCTVANSIQGTPTISVSARSLAPESVSSGH
jgi:uncharacterized OsmC-like protein